jgi:hypothetical protein
MLYAAKCYWPGVTQRELDAVGKRVARADGAYRGSLLFAGDELVLCIFEGASAGAVRSVCEQAGVPCERVMSAVWLANPALGGSKGEER